MCVSSPGSEGPAPWPLTAIDEGGVSRAMAPVACEYANRPLKPLQSIHGGSVRGGSTCLHNPAVTNGGAATPSGEAVPV